MLRQLPGSAEQEPVSAVEIRWTSLSQEAVLIIEHQLADDRGADESKSRRTDTIACCVGRFRKRICRQELKTVAESLVDCCLQRVVVRRAGTLDEIGRAHV